MSPKIINNIDKVALVGFNKDTEQILEDIESCKKIKKLAVYSSWLIQEDFEDLYKEKRPFNLYINTGNKNLEYVYKIEDFVTKKGSEGISCPETWKKFIDVNSYYYQSLVKNDYKVYPQCLNMPIKTWMLVSSIKKVETKIDWAKMQDIRGIPARSSGKSYYLYVVEPIKGNGD